MKRETAIKVALREISGEYVKAEKEFEANYLISENDLRLSRVNVWGSIVKKFKSENKEFTSLLIDDFSKVIAVNAFEEQAGMLDSVKEGDRVKVIGKVKQGKQGLFILCEGIKRISFQEELVKRLENLLSLKKIKREGKVAKEEKAEELFRPASELEVERKVIE